MQIRVLNAALLATASLSLPVSSSRPERAVTLSSVILSLAISSGIGVIFGLYPAVKAANLDPIAALRHQ